MLIHLIVLILVQTLSKLKHEILDKWKRLPWIGKLLKKRLAMV